MRRRFTAEGAETAKSGESGLNRERATTRVAPTVDFPEYRFGIALSLNKGYKLFQCW